MVLLHVLCQLAPSYRWKLTVAHLNHGLRGRSSDADERLVKRTARDLGLPVIARRGDVRSHALAEKLSIEMAARQLRHDFLASAACDAGASTIALAHHAGDQLELFFLRLLRGSGGDGLTGMKWRNPSPANPEIELVRPFLQQPKARLRDYARQEHIAFREDASNASLDMQRNRIRHELLPLLKRDYQPALETVIGRVMALTSAEAEFAAQAAGRWLSAARASQDCEPFEALPIAVQRRCLQTQLLDLGIRPEYDLVEHLRLKPGNPVCVPTEKLGVAGEEPGRPGSILRQATGLLSFPEPASGLFAPDSLEVRLSQTSGRIIFANVRIDWTIKAGKSRPALKPTPGSEVFDADRVGDRIVVRHWRPGDRFQPIGMPYAVKLQDFLTNRKVARSDRHRLILAEDLRGEVFWVERQRISDRFKLTEKTIHRLHWRWQRL